MRLFSQSFSGDVKMLFRGLVAGSIHDFQEFEKAFSRKWSDKKNPLKLVTQYKNFKKYHYQNC